MKQSRTSEFLAQINQRIEISQSYARAVDCLKTFMTMIESSHDGERKYKVHFKSKYPVKYVDEDVAKKIVRMFQLKIKDIILDLTSLAISNLKEADYGLDQEADRKAISASKSNDTGSGLLSPETKEKAPSRDNEQDREGVCEQIGNDEADGGNNRLPI